MTKAKMPKLPCILKKRRAWQKHFERAFMSSELYRILQERECENDKTSEEAFEDWNRRAKR